MTAEGAQTLRADLALVARGLFDSRAKAQEAIAAGLILHDGQPVRRAAERIDPAAALTARAPYPWVSRGGVKLAAALDRFGVDPAARVALDIGASTGGFTDVLLTRGAAVVHAVDVGHGQMHPSLRADPRVRVYEKTDARRLPPLDPQPTVLVCDVSFISLRLVLPAVLPLLGPDAEAIVLVKPQFEVGRGRSRDGIVRDAAARTESVEAVKACLTDLGWQVTGECPSPIAGGDGNIEFLLAAECRCTSQPA